MFGLVLIAELGIIESSNQYCYIFGACTILVCSHVPYASLFLSTGTHLAHADHGGPMRLRKLCRFRLEVQDVKTPNGRHGKPLKDRSHCINHMPMNCELFCSKRVETIEGRCSLEPHTKSCAMHANFHREYTCALLTKFISDGKSWHAIGGQTLCGQHHL